MLFWFVLVLGLQRTNSINMSFQTRGTLAALYIAGEASNTVLFWWEQTGNVFTSIGNFGS